VGPGRSPRASRGSPSGNGIVGGTLWRCSGGRAIEALQKQRGRGPALRACFHLSPGPSAGTTSITLDRLYPSSALSSGRRCTSAVRRGARRQSQTVVWRCHGRAWIQGADGPLCAPQARPVHHNVGTHVSQKRRLRRCPWYVSAQRPPHGAWLRKRRRQLTRMSTGRPPSITGTKRHACSRSPTMSQRSAPSSPPGAQTLGSLAAPAACAPPRRSGPGAGERNALRGR